MQDDKELLSRLSEGDPAAFDVIFNKYYRKVYAFSLHNFRNKEVAEGAVQDVFYNIWKDRSRIKEVKDLESWIFSICLNNIRKHFRKLTVAKKHLKSFTREYLESDNSTNTEVEYNDLLDKTDKIIEKLPRRQKTIFKYSTKESMSNYEISRELNISVRTVDNQLSRAKSFVKNALFEGGILSLLYIFFFIR